MSLPAEIYDRIITFQRTEITEHEIYTRLAATVGSPENRKILSQIADDELRHYRAWQTLTQAEVAPRRAQVAFYTWIGRLLGFTFAVKLMERGEGEAQEGYRSLVGKVEQAEQLLQEEILHEERLLQLLDEERLASLVKLDDGPVTRARLQQAFADHAGHPFGVCSHEDTRAVPVDRYATIASLVMDLTEQRMWLASGNPCTAPYIELEVPWRAERAR